MMMALGLGGAALYYVMQNATATTPITPPGEGGTPGTGTDPATCATHGESATTAKPCCTTAKNVGGKCYAAPQPGSIVRIPDNTNACGQFDTERVHAAAFEHPLYIGSVNGGIDVTNCGHKGGGMGSNTRFAQIEFWVQEVNGTWSLAYTAPAHPPTTVQVPVGVALERPIAGIGVKVRFHFDQTWPQSNKDLDGFVRFQGQVF